MPEQARIDVLQDIGMACARMPAVYRGAQIVLSRLPRVHYPRDLAAECLLAVQHLEYHQHPDDNTGSDLFQRVDYTITHGGNCEDLASVLVALYANLRLLSQALWIPQPDRPLNHVSVQVRVGNHWEWADPTVNAAFGESPYDAIPRIARVRPRDLVFRAGRAYR